MKSQSAKLPSLTSAGLDFVAQGFEMKPVTGPVKNVTGWISVTLAAVLLGAKLVMLCCGSDLFLPVPDEYRPLGVAASLGSQISVRDRCERGYRTELVRTARQQTSLPNEVQKRGLN
jgi:hypothetical protein